MTPRWHRILQKLQASTRMVDGPLPTPCWEWTGPDDGEQGYGRMSLDGHTVKVHRVGYMQFNGYLPPKKQVDHKCKNRRCWNPDHLEAVTHKQNQRRRRKDYVPYVPLTPCMEGKVFDLREGNVPIAELVMEVSREWQCACERLGVTRESAAVHGGKRCPGCPKALPATPVWREHEPAAAAPDLVRPLREPEPAEPPLGLEEPAGDQSTPG